MFDQPGAFDPPAGYGPAAPMTAAAPATPPVKRPHRWGLSNWPVGRKVIAIALIPLLLAAVFGGLRIYSSVSQARNLSVAAKRADLVPDIVEYMAALQNALVATVAGGDPQATQQYEAHSAALQQRLSKTDVASDVRFAVTALLGDGNDLLSKATSNAIDLRQEVITYAPLLLTAETAITGSVRVDDETLRTQAEGLSRAVGARGQMAMERMLVERGGDLPEPVLRSSMTTLAGTEPSTVTGMSQLLGGASEQASELRSQMVARLLLLSDPDQELLNNPQLLQSIQTTAQIAQQLINNTTKSITTTVHNEAAQQRNQAIRDAIAVLAAFLVVLAIVFLVARSLTGPLRRLRDGALKIAHEDLARGIARVKAGDEREPDPLPIHTTEEVGQVAHAVDELHTQALLLAGDEARLRVMVDDMFETMSRRNKTLVDQQLSLIDRLERNEDDPDRLDSLFRLDHLATRMRRNGANLLVLAGAQASREHAEPVALASLINAAASEVEDYQRVETGMVPDVSLIGDAAGTTVHLLAELIDNALRCSPPTEQVRVTAVQGADGGVMVDVDDAGLGMTDADLRIANMRLNAGGEVNPDNARHMGLFVVGRLAREHGIAVRLLTPVSGRGTTAQVYLPAALLVHAHEPDLEPVLDHAGAADLLSQDVAAAPAPGSLFESAPSVPEEAEPEGGGATAADQLNGSGEASVTLLPRRSPGSSGITGESADLPFDESGSTAERPPAQAWWAPVEVPAESEAEEEVPPVGEAEVPPEAEAEVPEGPEGEAPVPPEGEAEVPEGEAPVPPGEAEEEVPKEQAEEQAQAAPAATADAPANTSGFFASRRRARQLAAEAAAAAAAEAAAAEAEPEVEPEEADEATELEAADEADEATEPEAADEADEHTEPDEAVEHTDEPEADVEPDEADEAVEPEADEPAAEGPDELHDTGSLAVSDMNKLAAELAAKVTTSGVDLIYQRMISEWLVDPQQLAVSQDWKSVWDNGWAAAEAADRQPVVAHTDHGLPVREPGARLIPGGTSGLAEAGPRNREFGDRNAVASNGGQNSGSEVHQTDGREALERDPDAIRTSISNHFGGVRAGRSHARNTTQGRDH